jgi:hypothetical protein
MRLRWILGLLVFGMQHLPAQIPFTADDERFHVYCDGRFQLLEPRPPRRHVMLEGSLLYEDHTGRLKFFRSCGNGVQELQAGGVERLEGQGRWAAWTTAGVLRCLVGDTARLLAEGVRDFAMSQELLVHVDGLTTRVQWREGSLDLPIAPTDTVSCTLGDNTLLFTESTGRLVLFHGGRLEVLHGTGVLLRAAGRDVAAWYAPGELGVWTPAGVRMHPLPQAFVPSRLDAGEGMVVVAFPSGNLHGVWDGEVKLVDERGATFIGAAGRLCLYLLHGQLMVHDGEQVQRVEPYVPEWWRVSGGELIYLDINRELRSLRNGRRERLGREANAREPVLHGGAVMYRSTKGGITVLDRGRTYLF